MTCQSSGVAIDIEQQRGIGEVEQPRRVAGVSHGDHEMARLRQPGDRASNQRGHGGVRRLAQGTRRAGLDNFAQASGVLGEHGLRQAECGQQPSAGLRADAWRRRQTQPGGYVCRIAGRFSHRWRDSACPWGTRPGQRGVVAISPTFITFDASVTSA